MVQEVCEKLLSILHTDPEMEVWDGNTYPKEYLYTIRLVEWLRKIHPKPSDELLIAAHGQHLYRWRVPRKTYPMDRNGYLMWRRKLANMHAGETVAIVASFGYSPEFTARIAQIIKKENLTDDAEVKFLEDAINLSFVQYYMVSFAGKYEHKNLLDITLKVLRKMSPEARNLALEIDMPEGQRKLILEAAALLTD